MVETETEQMMKDFESRLSMQGMNLDLYFQFSGQNEDALKEQMRTDAIKRVRNNLVLEAIAKAENLEISDADIEEELTTLSKMYNRPAEELRTLFSSNGYMDTLNSDLKVRKAVKFILEESKTA
jgi:trigger factor